MAPRIPNVRITPDDETVRAQLGLLRDFAGTWSGYGFNLIARPDAKDGTNLYLELNQTHEVLKLDTIGSSIPNRAFGQNEDLELFGLTYLQKISDVVTGGALHIEPGIWVTQGSTAYPPETAPAGAQIIARMASIPHGNSMLAEGIAEQFEGAPTLTAGGSQYAFSKFPSFNSTPFPVPASPGVPAFNAAGSSEKLTVPVPPNFQQYDISLPISSTNTRTPFGNTPPVPLPASILGVPMQDVVNDPILLLQAVIKQQVAEGHSFKGSVLNIATQVPLTFLTTPNTPTGPTVKVSLTDGGGGIENIPFLEGGEPVGAQGPNADTVTVYATFWIEHVMPKNERPFTQLQYAQMVVLNFPIFLALPKVVMIGWPHISVATLRKTFG
jgi:hypothetical protein